MEILNDGFKINTIIIGKFKSEGTIMIPTVFTHNRKINLFFADRSSRLVLVIYIFNIKKNKSINFTIFKMS